VGDLQPRLFRPPVLDPVEPDDLTDILFIIFSLFIRFKPVVNLRCQDFPERLLFTRIFVLKKIFTIYTHIYCTRRTLGHIYIYVSIYRCHTATRGCVPRFHQRRQLSGHNQCSFVLRKYGAETLETIYNTIAAVLQFPNYTMLWFFSYKNYNTITGTKLMNVLG